MLAEKKQGIGSIPSLRQTRESLRENALAPWLLPVDRDCADEEPGPLGDGAGCNAQTTEPALRVIVVSQVHLNSCQLQDRLGQWASDLKASGALQCIHQALMCGSAILSLQVCPTQLHNRRLVQCQLIVIADIGDRLIEEVGQLTLPPRIRWREEAS